MAKVGKLLIEGSNCCEEEFEWDDLCDTLSSLIRRKNPDGYWKGRVENFGWRGVDGWSVFFAESGLTFLGSILPNTSCNFKIYNYGKGLALQNFHHDSPWGREWYYLTPTTVGVYAREKR